MKIKKKIGVWKDIGMMLAIVTIVISFVTIASAGQNEGTPIQNAIKQAIANGNFSVNDIENPEYNIEILEKNETHIKLKSNTRITFKNPRGAGYGNNRWPKFEINNSISNENNITSGDYDQTVKDAILSELQKIGNEAERSEKLAEWNSYNFEYGERTYVFNETYEITYYNESYTSPREVLSINNVLMGFTKTAKIDWTWNADLYIIIKVASVKAGVEIDSAIGLRLPVEVGLNLPDNMISGQNYLLDAYTKGIDWDATKYSMANVPPENGNEFVARTYIFAGIRIWIIGIGNFGPYIEKSIDYSKNFKTPFGTGEEFPIPDVTGTVFQINYGPLSFGMGFKIDPDLGSKDISANWVAEGDSSGSGSVTFHEPGTSYNLNGPIHTGDYSSTTDYANIRLSDFKYYFSICLLKSGINIKVGIFGINIETPYLNIFNVDCSGITGGLYLGTHLGTSANSATGSIFVQKYDLETRFRALENRTKTLENKFGQMNKTVNRHTTLIDKILAWIRTEYKIDLRNCSLQNIIQRKC